MWDQSAILKQILQNLFNKHLNQVLGKFLKKLQMKERKKLDSYWVSVAIHICQIGRFNAVFNIHKTINNLIC